MYTRPTGLLRRVGTPRNGLGPVPPLPFTVFGTPIFNTRKRESDTLRDESLLTFYYYAKPLPQQSSRRL